MSCRLLSIFRAATELCGQRLLYGPCVRFGADVLEVQFFERQKAQAKWEGPLPYCHSVLPGANATARMRRVQDELCLSRAGSDNKRLLDAATSMVCTLLLTLNIPSLARQRCLPSWGPRRTPWFFFCNFSTV